MRGLLLLVVAFLVLATSVSAVVFVSVKSLQEGLGKNPPIIAAASGCLMSWKHQLFTYEAASDVSMTAAVIQALDEDFGLVALQGHGSALTLDHCQPAENADVFAAFLKPFVGHLKQVASYGCHTGQQFTTELHGLLVKDGHKDVVVFGPAYQLVMDCGGPLKGHGRIFLNAQNLGLATPDWQKMRDLYQTALGQKVADFWKLQQDVGKIGKPVDQVVAFRTLAVSLAVAYTPLWREFIQYCDGKKYMFANGEGWLRLPKLFFFRQLLKNKMNRVARNRAAEPSYPFSTPL